MRAGGGRENSQCEFEGTSGGKGVRAPTVWRRRQTFRRDLWLNFRANLHGNLMAHDSTAGQRPQTSADSATLIRRSPPAQQIDLSPGHPQRAEAPADDSGVGVAPGDPRGRGIPSSVRPRPARFQQRRGRIRGTSGVDLGCEVISQLLPDLPSSPIALSVGRVIAYQFVLSDFVARVVAVLFGLATIVVCYHLGALLYDRRTGLLAAGILAVMPYHVIVSRQALLDGPEVFFTTLALYALAKYRTKRRLTMAVRARRHVGARLPHEGDCARHPGRGVHLLPLDAEVRLTRRVVMLSVGLFVGLAFVYPVATAFGGASKSGKSFFLWQLLRKPNHGYGFYLDTSLPDLGILVIAVAVATLFALRRERYMARDVVALLDRRAVRILQRLADEGVPVPLAHRAAARGSRRERSRAAPHEGRPGAVTALVFTVVAISLVVPSWSSINTESRSSSLAGTGGLPAGRETGRWMRDHLPEDIQMLAIGPSMANVLEFYGNRKVWGLSVSSDPRQRNPGLPTRQESRPRRDFSEGTIQYIVWDAFSADRSKRSSDRLLGYVSKYGGRLIYEATIPGQREPVIRIFEEQP